MSNNTPEPSAATTDHQAGVTALLTIDVQQVLENIAMSRIGAKKWEHMPPMRKHNYRESLLPAINAIMDQVKPTLVAAGSQLIDTLTAIEQARSDDKVLSNISDHELTEALATIAMAREMTPNKDGMISKDALLIVLNTAWGARPEQQHDS